jgi:hypothetical protein
MSKEWKRGIGPGFKSFLKLSQKLRIVIIAWIYPDNIANSKIMAKRNTLKISVPTSIVGDHVISRVSMLKTSSKAAV